MPKILTAHVSDLRPGEMREIEVLDKKFLLVRTFDGVWHAFSATCPHAGAPLEKGALCGTRLICPWHKSCFGAMDGVLLEPPSLESLESYSLEVVGEEIQVDLEDSARREHFPVQGIVSPGSEKTFALLGGGAAAIAAASELRALGFAGRLIMISQEERRPYDRTLLSKMYLSGQAEAKQLPLRPESLLDDCQVEFLKAEIDQVDVDLRTIHFKGNLPSLRYDEALVATGGKPKRLPLPSSSSQPIVLRNVEDANQLVAEAQNAQTVVLIGASFISMEVASAFRERGLAVTLISEGKIPLLKQLGEQMGKLLQQKHVEKGVRFIPESKVLAITTGTSGSIIKLNDGLDIAADFVVSGIGIEPATRFLEGLSLNEDRSLSVDAFMRVLGVEGLFAAGDVANFPLSSNGERTRIEHWRVAQEQGRTAAASMLGLKQPYEGVPYFWTYHYGVRYEFFGQLPPHFELLIDGDLDEPRFIAAYLVEDRCQAVFAANRESDSARIFDHLRHQGTPSRAALEKILRAGG